MIIKMWFESRNKIFRRLSIHLGYLIPLLILFLLDVSHPAAQGAYFWSMQKRIPEYYDSTEEPPYLIADMNRTVHAFNSQPLNLNDGTSPKAVFYRQWTLENGWTYPNDILFDIDGFSLVLLGVTYDQSGRVYLIVQRNNDIYYTQNYLANANIATSWSPLIQVAGNTVFSGPGIEIVAAIATNEDGSEIVIVFSGRQDDNGLYFTSSMDGGGTWTNPYPLYLTGDETMVVTDPKLYVGKSGNIHAVWSTFLKSGAGGPGYYANFNPSTNTWSQPVELDTPGFRTPSVFEYRSEVFVSYHHINVNGNMWCRSSDGGQTWTSPVQISSRHVGTNGAVSFVVDSADTLHAFFGERIDDNNHGMWHSIWTGSTWSSPEAVVRGPQIKDAIGGKGFDPRSARAVVSNGNLILVTWGTDGAGGSNGAWYSYKRLDTPELPALPLPVPAVTILNVSTEEVLPLVTTAVRTATKPSAILGNTDNTPSSLLDPQLAILVGLIPALLLLAGIFLVRYISRSRNT